MVKQAEKARKIYPFPDREIANESAWKLLLELTDSDEYGVCFRSDIRNDRGGYEDDMIAIAPYWYGDEENTERERPNFLYKPTGFAIWWYKYAFRASEMNMDLTADDIIQLFLRIDYYLLDKKYGEHPA